MNVKKMLALGLLGNSTSVKLIRDEFTAANGTAVNGRTPAPLGNGATWSVSLRTNADMQIQSNRATGVHVAVPTYPAAQAVIECGTPNVQVDCIWCGANASSNSATVLRAVDIDNRWQVDPNCQTNVFRLADVVAGAATIRASVSVTVTPGVEYAVSVTAMGNTISATLNGGSQISYTSATFNTATKHGFVTRINGDYIDNLEIKRL